MKIIACSGQMRMGKDVLCDGLCEKLNSIILDSKCEIQDFWQRTSFAAAVKKVFTDSFDVDNDFVEKWKVTSEIPPGFLKPVRQSLQFIGDGFRQIKDEIWIEIALRNKNRIILSDARYINEAKKVQEEGGITILLYRPGFLNDDPNPSESQIKSILEFCAANLDEGPIPDFFILKNQFGNTCPDAIQYYNYFMVNNGTVQDLHNKITKKLVPYVFKISNSI